jgi:prepilin-type N-terminal cleavage/methylation domain-containing protein
MSRISVHSSRRRGFTLVELMVATSVSAIVFAGILAAYLFMGRNLTRLVNTQQQEAQSRRALRQFTQDVSAGTQISVPASGQLWVTKPTASGTTTIKYVYSSGTGTLVRNDGADQKILSSLTALSYVFYSESGATVTASNLQSAKSVQLTFSSSIGTSNAGTQSQITTVSPRVVLRNKPMLQ